MAEDKDRDDHHNGNDNHDDQSDVAHGTGVPAPSPAQVGSIPGKPTAGMANTVAGLAAALLRCWDLSSSIGWRNPMAITAGAGQRVHHEISRSFRHWDIPVAAHVRHGALTWR